MRRGFPHALAPLAVVIALAACTHSSETPPLPPPTADEVARASYARIVSGANALLVSDQLAYFGTDDGIERTRTRCLDDLCSTGFTRFVRTSGFSVDSVQLELLGERRGVSLVVERASGQYTDVHVYGGWLEHSLFATEAFVLTNAELPDRGATVVNSYAIGFSTGENPDDADGSARWEGLVIGRDMSASESRGQVVVGDADVTVEFGTAAMTADVEFTGIVNVETDDPHDDMAWSGMAVEGGAFAHGEAADGTISGRFFGPNEEEVGGVFERAGIAGTFGGKRTSD